jgi:ABC-2 type transport system ATP-binding protein
MISEFISDKPMLLRTEHLTKDYGRSRALDDLNLTIEHGEVFGLLGPNGSGKTTALRLLLGFLRPTAGHAWIEGYECWRDSLAVRRRVAYLPGELRLYENMTGRQLIHFLGRLRGQTVREDLDVLARRFDIDLDRALTQLSSGMKRKVALLQVLVPRTPLVIMDEPTNALDPTMRDELLEQVREAHKRGQTVLFSSHVLSEVEDVCDRVAILHRGRLAHVQVLSELREGRLIQARVLGDGAALTPLAGLHVRDRHHDWLALEYIGPLPQLLAWLAQQPLADLRMEPLGLKAVYRRYHDNDATEA